MDGLIFFAHSATVGIVVGLFTAVLPFPLYSYYFAFMNFILYFIVAISTYRVTKGLLCRGRIQPKNKAVLITGCGSGFGKALAKRLDSKGFHVFASCHYPEGEGVDDLKRSCSDRLKVFCLDVSKDESVEKAVAFVRNNLGSNDLWAVVNNAGATKAFSGFDVTSFDNFKYTMDVNVFGTIRVTKAFLPILKKSKGRIVNVNSVLGRISMQNAAAYIMSKHAGTALTECLSLEMEMWGIRVISIEPELYQSKLVNVEKIIASSHRELGEAPKDIVLSYGEKYMKKLENFTKNFINLASSNINNVIDAMESAVTLKNPCHVYTPSRNIFFQVLFFISENMPFEIYRMVIRILFRILGHPSFKDIAHNNSTEND